MIFLLTLSAGTIYFIFAIYWSPAEGIQYKREIWKGVILDIPPIIFALLLLDAFRRMRSMKQESIALSNSQLILQISSNVAFAAIQLPPFMVKQETPLWQWLYCTAMTVDMICLLILTRTLCSICDIQMKHEEPDSPHGFHSSVNIEESAFLETSASLFSARGLDLAESCILRHTYDLSQSCSPRSPRPVTVQVLDVSI